MLLSLLGSLFSETPMPEVQSAPCEAPCILFALGGGAQMVTRAAVQAAYNRHTLKFQNDRDM